MDEVVRAVRACPSGALGLRLFGESLTNPADQQREPVVEISRDGPYRVRGGIQLKDADGNPVLRNKGASLEHYSLCRCGHSLNKPFCSGMHWYVDFHDPVMPDAPTIFEWAGGLPALTRLTRLFFEKYVPDDPLLAPLFAQMSPDLPDRFAAWMGEVFGGPKEYSERFGDHPHMLSRHAGSGITEEQRARWVAIFIRCADESCLPTDAEFRSAFTAYLDWGSRVVLATSTEG
jgi:truncated hemoglobin YjbI/CDGSH-type Zn-finger protein